MDISEKAAYLRGLFEGLGIDRESKEGKVFAVMIDILDDMADSIEDLNDGLEFVGYRLDDIDEDLGFDDDYDDDDDFDYDGELYEVTCPTCKNIVYMDEEMLDEGELPCPDCGELLEIDLDGIVDDSEI
jgi:hypothetical protein